MRRGRRTALGRRDNRRRSRVAGVHAANVGRWQGRAANVELRCDARAGAAGMVAVEDSPWQRRWLHHILWHVSRSQARAASLGAQLSLHIDSFLEKDALEQRVLVAQHQTLVGGVTVGSLQVVEVLLMDADSLLELLDVFGAAFTEGGLRLAVSLLALLRCRVDWLATTLALDGLVLGIADAAV